MLDLFQTRWVLVNHHEVVTGLEKFLNHIVAGFSRAANNEVVAQVPNLFEHLSSPKKILQFAFHDERRGGRKKVKHDPDAEQDHEHIEDSQ